MIAQFTLRLLCGMSMMWCVMPRNEVTSGFFRIQMLLALGLSVLAALAFGSFGTAGANSGVLLSPPAGVWSCVGLAIAAFFGSIAWTLERRPAGTGFVLVMALGSACVLVSSSVPIWPQFSGGSLLLLLSELSSALMLGGATTGMLLGHWYLTAPTMSIAPLRRLTAYFAMAALLRLVLSALGLVLAWDQFSASTHWLWLALRWTAGIFAPILVAVMAWRILRYRNTQAATGVLFVAVILTFIGELTAMLLRQELSTPL
jgi:hypothetical protein